MPQLTAADIPTGNYASDQSRKTTLLTHDYEAPNGKNYHTQIAPNGWFVYEGKDASGKRIAYKAYPAYDPLEEAKAAIASHYNANSQ